MEVKGLRIVTAEFIKGADNNVQGSATIAGRSSSVSFARSPSRTTILYTTTQIACIRPGEG